MRQVKAALVAARWQAVRRTNALRQRVGLAPLSPGRPLFTLPTAGTGQPGPSGTGQVAITVDDGPHPQWTPLVLETLSRLGVKATFFMVGDEVTRYPHIARQVAAHGHDIGNHTMHHIQPFSALTAVEIGREIADASAAIEDITGCRPGVFRAPAGSWSADVLDAAEDLGMVPVDWTVDPEDWRPRGRDQIFTAIAACRPSDIILCHDGGGDRSRTVQALADAIPVLRQRGLDFAFLRAVLA
jgi:peptidoglycan/xylan/chitin deacetylase (PgdA/CDA1 family)